MKSILTLFIATAMLVGISGSAVAQTEADLYKQGIKYKSRINNSKMLEVFKKLYKMDSNNVKYATNISIACSRYGANRPDKSERTNYYAKAKRIAKRALKLSSGNAEANYAYALALARENEFAGSKVKLGNAKEIRTHCEKAIKLNPKKAGGSHHIMGRWHREFAAMSSAKKSMAKLIYGSVPEGGTFTAAVKHFKKAIESENWYMLHYYELAKTYHMMGNDDLAKQILTKAMKLPQSYEDAKKAYKKCEELKKSLK